MTLTIENFLFVGSLLLLISIFAGKTSYKFGVPTLILFLVIGMLSGSEGLVGIHFDNPEYSQFIGIVSLNFILFSGGLDTNWRAVKPILKEGLVLSTLGVLLTAATLGVFVYMVTDFTIFESLLLGSIVSSTDAAAVFSILRSKGLALKYNLRPTLELESGSNDPMAYVLTIAFLSLVVNQDKEIFDLIPLFIKQMSIGAVAGLLFGKLNKKIINKISLDFEGLYPILVIALMFLTFSATDYLGGNGFLAIYFCAVYLGNQDLIHKKAILKMFDGLAWLMQIVLFLTLGLLVYPSHVYDVFGIGLLISVFLILVARPLSVFICTIPFKMKLNQKLYLSWVGLRGAVPIVFATYPLIAGIDKADMIFNIVFFISLSSILLQGTTLSVMAKWLKVAIPENLKPLRPNEALILDNPKNNFKQIEISSKSLIIGEKIVDLEFPETSVITLIKRGDKYLIPNGATVIQPNDLLSIISSNESEIEKIKSILQ